MIDFRYHVVSLAAVLLALAVGIVLGAGPLRDELATTVEAQIQELGKERSALRAQLTEAVRREDAKDALIGAVSPALLADRLDGDRVAMVLVPGADGGVADDAVAALDAAGAEVVSTTDLQATLEDPTQAAANQAAAAEVAPLVGDPTTPQGTEPTIETVLAAVLAGIDEPGQSGTWQEAQQRLEDLGLIDTSWLLTDAAVPGVEDRRPPDVVVLVVGGLDNSETGQADPVTQQRLQVRLALVGALGATDLPVVVIGGGTQTYTDPVEDAEDRELREIRGDNDLRDLVSTVDDTDVAAGAVALVLAVADAMDGAVGHYGLGLDAQGPIPAVPAPPALPTPPTTDSSTSTSGTGASEPSTDDAALTTVP